MLLTPGPRQHLNYYNFKYFTYYSASYSYRQAVGRKSRLGQT